ncbi:pilus assembly protein TadG-related protein [Brachybacterium hainanense]|uniref:Pilus assembly protein TadG-related protein n=1 Tax=Brachybacterium hainanense TaxID=1541174 RepID=A0ABV6RFF0_9MICO
MRARLRSALTSDRGTLTILITGVLVVILMIAALGVAVTGVHLERASLQDAADGAALAASQAIDPRAIYAGDGQGGPRVLTEVEARREAESFLSAYPLSSTRLRDVRVAAVGTMADGTVEVTLAATVDPPLIGWFTRGAGVSIPLATEGSARAR